MSETPFDLTEALHLAFQEHGLTASRDGSEVRVSEGPLIASANIVRVLQEGKLVQLDVSVKSPLLGDATLLESCAGLGEDQKHAEKDAFCKFLTNAFQVIVVALAGEERDANQIEWEEWEQGWKVCMGPLVFLMSTPEDIDFGAFLDSIKGKLLARLQPGYHWLRLYYMRNGKEPMVSEALLDNDPWPEGQALIDAWPWPDGKYSFRNFMILVPMAAPGGAKK